MAMEPANNRRTSAWPVCLEDTDKQPTSYLTPPATRPCLIAASLSPNTAVSALSSCGVACEREIRSISNSKTVLKRTQSQLGEWQHALKLE